MEEESEQNASVSLPVSSSPFPPSSSSQAHEGAGSEENSEFHPVEDETNLQQQLRRSHRQSVVSYRLNFSISNAVPSTQMRDDVWSCLIVLVTFWFFAASMTVMFGFYGSVNMALGPNCSRKIKANSFFVQSIKAQEIESKHGPMLYGFYDTPSLDTEITWSETHNAFIQSNYHKEWEYFLNEGSEVVISYSIKSPSFAPLSLVIAQGKESLVEWIEDPSYPNTTLSWNIIDGSGVICQKISKPKMYYIAVGNLNTEEVEVQLNFTIKSLIYNTTQAYFKCSLGHQLCSLKLFLLRTNVAVITSPGIEQGLRYDNWYVRLSYGPRWLTYFAGSGTLTALVLLAVRLCNMFQITRTDETGVQEGETAPVRAPLLTRKDDDLLSWGSSYDSVSHDEEELDELLAMASLEGKPPKDGENNGNHRRLCVMCFDASRDCFFLPCGHCACCFTCGTRIVEEGGNCPICCRTTRKVRKIFTV
ncbi:Ubiquitin--protein ligase [Bertholletia excelsa]